MATFIQDEFVKLSYTIEYPDSYPDADDLRKFDQLLERRYGTIVDAEMVRAGIPVTRRNRSIVILLTPLLPGMGRTQMRKACNYWALVSKIQRL